MDWAGWALFGLLATAILTAVMIAAQLAGWTRLDLPLLLGAIVTEDLDRARVVGFFSHGGDGQRADAEQPAHIRSREIGPETKTTGPVALRPVSL
jgi:hypothetical protein